MNLEKLRVSALHPKRAITGALVLEIPGPDGIEKAKALKEKLQCALGNMEGMRVARPVKSVDLRVKDVIESITEDEIRQAIVDNQGQKRQKSRRYSARSVRLPLPPREKRTPSLYGRVRQTRGRLTPDPQYAVTYPQRKGAVPSLYGRLRRIRKRHLWRLILNSHCYKDRRGPRGRRTPALRRHIHPSE